MRRLGLVLGLWAMLLGTASAQDLKTVEIKIRPFDHVKNSEQELLRNSEPFQKIAAGTAWYTELIYILAIVGGALAAVFVVVTVVLKPKGTTDPLQLAMQDPWMRSRIEAMSPAERQQFLGRG